MDSASVVDVKSATESTKKISRKRRSSSLWLHKPKRIKRPNLEQKQGTSTPFNATLSVKPDSATLLCAPSKPNKGHVKGKKKLFEDSISEQLIKEMKDLVPSLLRVLQTGGIMHDFCSFLRLISSGNFPLKNIAFLLLLDVVRWFSLGSTTQMTYGEDSLKFWRVLYRLFHGKCLRFMSGKKSSGQVITNETTKGHYDPKTTKINFAVPDLNTVSQFRSTEINLPAEIPPGVIKQAMEMRELHKTYVLTVDGKKLAPGLTNEKGDIDLFGYEDGDSLRSTKDRLDVELSETECTKEEWSFLSFDEKKCRIERIVLIISRRIQDLRTLFVKQSLALKKFEKEAGADWRNSKYVFAISSVQAMIFQLKAMIRRLLDINNCLLEIGSTMNGTPCTFVQSGILDAFLHENWISLKEPGDLPDNIKHMSEYIKQRTPEWFEMRSNYSVTGSKIFESVGLDTLKNMQKHVEKVQNPGQVVEEVSDIVKERMEHGTKSEINAVATLVGKVLPFYFPECKYIEEGSHTVKRGDSPLMLISPDGSIGHVNISSTDRPLRILGCEFKCPVPAVYKTQVHYNIPVRYVPQVLGEMACMNVSELIYLCWTDESSTVFRVTFDKELWEMIEIEAATIYATKTLKKPTRISEEAKAIRSKLGQFAEHHVKFICEIPSLRGSCSQMSQSNDTSPYLFPIPVVGTDHTCSDSIENVLTSATTALKDVFQLCRKKATEVLVWLLSDTDRSWNPELPHSIPVAYGMKGYSLASETMRKMHNHILDECLENGLDVVCSCFDGQWIRLATRDENNKPLTEMQLQRDVWDTATKTKRNVIVKELATSKIVKDFSSDVEIIKHANGSVFVHCGRLASVMTSVRNMPKKSESVNKPNDDQNNNEISSDTLSCLPEAALETLIETDEIATELLKTQSDIEQDNRDITEEENVDVVRTVTLTKENQSNHQRHNISDCIYVNILGSLQGHAKTSVSRKWKEKCLSDLKKVVLDSSAVHTLTHDELNVMIKETESIQTASKFYIRKSWKLADKANGICKLIGSGKEVTVERTVKKLFTLSECASKVVMANTRAIKKSSLNNAYAAFIYPACYDKWLGESIFNTRTEIQDIGHTKWFSYPEFSQKRNKLEPKCLDAHHLLVNLRVKVCKDGVKGIKKEAWHSVAESDSSIINKGIVVDLVDRQNNAFAMRTFSDKVEDEMRKLHYYREADFCNLIRKWYEAEDEPGLSGKERILRRLRVKEFLLRDVDLSIFPPYGMYVNGFPKVWFEGILQRIDTTIQLYHVVKSGSFNQRSISSLVNETFFGEISDMEPTKLGCPKAINIPRLMSTVTELMHYRCDPSDRAFHMNTTKRSVYPKEPLLPAECSGQTNGGLEPLACTVSIGLAPEILSKQETAIIVKDHYFDKYRRLRKKRQSKRDDVSKPHQVSRGCLPVRQHHKCDESKILPTTRLGIDLKNSVDQ